MSCHDIALRRVGGVRRATQVVLKGPSSNSKGGWMRELARVIMDQTSRESRMLTDLAQLPVFGPESLVE